VVLQRFVSPCRSEVVLRRYVSPCMSPVVLQRSGSPCRSEVVLQGLVLGLPLQHVITVVGAGHITPGGRGVAIPQKLCLYLCDRPLLILLCRAEGRRWRWR